MLRGESFSEGQRWSLYFGARKIASCLKVPSEPIPSSFSAILLELPWSAFLASPKDLLCINKATSSQDFSSLNPNRTQLDFPSRLQDLDSTVHWYASDFRTNQWASTKLKLHYVAFLLIVAFFIFKALLVMPFVRNASVFPADMHKAGLLRCRAMLLILWLRFMLIFIQRFYLLNFEFADWRDQDIQLQGARVNCASEEKDVIQNLLIS